jgi:hypothetical protein
MTTKSQFLDYAVFGSSHICARISTNTGKYKNARICCVEKRLVKAMPAACFCWFLNPLALEFPFKF